MVPTSASRGTLGEINLFRKNMRIRIRKTTKKDLKFVIDTENNNENKPYITQWELSEHEIALKDKNILSNVLNNRK